MGRLRFPGTTVDSLTLNSANATLRQSTGTLNVIVATTEYATTHPRAVQAIVAALPDAARTDLAAVCELRDDHETRILHAAGKAYPDLVRLRVQLKDTLAKSGVRVSGSTTTFSRTEPNRMASQICGSASCDSLITFA